MRERRARTTRLAATHHIWFDRIKDQDAVVHRCNNVADIIAAHRSNGILGFGRRGSEPPVSLKCMGCVRRSKERHLLLIQRTHPHHHLDGRVGHGRQNNTEADALSLSRRVRSRDPTYKRHAARRASCIRAVRVTKKGTQCRFFDANALSKEARQ